MLKSKSWKEVSRLFNVSENISSRLYNSDIIKGLPVPVQRYFNFSLSENQSYISYVRLKHSGEFKPQDKWTPIKGEEYFTTQNPGFIWFGKIPLLSAKDIYYNGEGNLVIKLLSFIKIANLKGEEINQGELLRWLAEAPCFPTALLPSDKLTWESIDDSSAKVIFTDNNLTIEGIFHFADSGEITHFKAKRFRDKTLEDWTGYYKDFRTVDSMKIPFHLEVAWNLQPGDLKYVNFTIDTIEFNNPKKYK